MHTGDAGSLRETEARALAIGERIAALLNELDALAPGGTTAAGGSVMGPGVRIRRTGQGWTATP